MKVDGKARAPLHPIDWKDEDFTGFTKSGAFPKSADIAPQPRTHVEIEGDVLVASEQNLFTTVAQGSLGGDKKAKRAWRDVVDFAHVEDWAKRAQLLALIESGLYALGRTGACARFERILSPPADAKTFGTIRLREPPEPRPIKGSDKRYALTLITPALLTDPRANEAIEDQYTNRIAAETDGKLLRSYTTRRLAGGYIATRRRPYEETYYPFVLTEPGSVFLIEGGDETKLTEVARFGLRPVALINAAPLTWKNCPYLRENGYGEVVFSLVDHAKLVKALSDG